jgi:hypothetical protein
MISFGGRKFILAMVVVLITSALVAFKVIDQGGYVTVVMAVVGAYLTANVAQKKVAPMADQAAPQ